MSIVSLAEFRAMQRELADNAADPEAQAALAAAEESVETFIGFSLSEFDGDVPAALRYAIGALASVITGFIPGAMAMEVRGNVETALRPYRREPRRDAARGG